MHTPDQLQAGIQAIIDDLTARLAAKGYSGFAVQVEFGTPIDVVVSVVRGPLKRGASFVHSPRLDDAVEAMRERIAGLPDRTEWTTEAVGRTLGIIDGGAA